MGIFDWFKRKDGKSIKGKNKNAEEESYLYGMKEEKEVEDIMRDIISKGVSKYAPADDTDSSDIKGMGNDSYSKLQNMVFDIYPKLKGLDFEKVKFDVSGDNPKDFFASDIDGSWYFATSQMTMLFKAFSKKEIDKQLKKLLELNGIKYDDAFSLNGVNAWKGDGFQIEHPIIEGNDIIIITNEDVAPVDSEKLQTTTIAPEVDLPDGYKNIGIEHVYDGDKFLNANQGSFSLNVPLLFKSPEDNLNYIIIGVSTLTLAKKIIDDIIDKNYGKASFKKLDDQNGWEYLFQNNFFSIGFSAEHFCIRINMLHNLVEFSTK